MTVIEQLQEFIRDADKRVVGCSKWLSDDTMKVYVRRSRRVLTPGKYSTTLDIAAVSVTHQGRGVWTAFIGQAHAMNPWDATFSECVHNPNLANWLMRHGWTPVYQGPYIESFYLPKKVE